MAQINKPSDYFNTVLYTGNGSTQSITGVGFQPDWVWVKDRDTAGYNHIANDNVRGVTKYLRPNLTNAEATITDAITSFDSDGFSLGSDSSNGEHNRSGINYASWNWLASNTTASNTDGSITSTVSANTTSGFSIVSYTGNLTANATVGHSLGVAPAMIIIKNRTDAVDWFVYHKSLTSTYNMKLNTTDAEFGGAYIFDSTSSTFKLRDHNVVNGSGDNLIAYCFAEKKGFSKFGSYTGNGSSDGAFIYTGFKPAWVMIKRTNTSGDAWVLFDNKRPGYNLIDNFLEADASGVEAVNNPNQRIDTVSNGFKCRGTGTATNTSGSNYIYMAFAENPLVGTNNIPATAR